MNNGDNKKKTSVTRSVGDLLPITFHVPVEKADSHGSGSCFVNTQMLQPLLLMQIWIFMSLWGSIRRQNCFSLYAWLERNDCGRYETWVCGEAQAGGILKKVSNFPCTVSWSRSVGPILYSMASILAGHFKGWQFICKSAWTVNNALHFQSLLKLLTQASGSLSHQNNIQFKVRLVELLAQTE